MTSAISLQHVVTSGMGFRYAQEMGTQYFRSLFSLLDRDFNIFRTHSPTLDRFRRLNVYVAIFALTDIYSPKHRCIYQQTSQCYLHQMHCRCTFSFRFLGKTGQNALSFYTSLVLTKQKEQ